MSDNVNHPSHYTDGCGFECIEMMRIVFGADLVTRFCLMNAFKYIWRHKMKGGMEDLKKAEWYLNVSEAHLEIAGYSKDTEVFSWLKTVLDIRQIELERATAINTEQEE